MKRRHGVFKTLPAPDANLGAREHGTGFLRPELSPDELRPNGRADAEMLHPANEPVPGPVDPGEEVLRVDVIVEVDAEEAVAEEQGPGFVADLMAGSEEGELVFLFLFVDFPDGEAQRSHSDLLGEGECVDREAQLGWQV